MGIRRTFISSLVAGIVLTVAFTLRAAPRRDRQSKGEEVTLVGFGTFYAGNRAARTGRNPRTGEPVEIKAAKLPKFRAGKALKDAIN